jgi:hypothetical protein
MKKMTANYNEFNLNYYENPDSESNNLRGRIKFPILLPIAKKNYFLRPVARCGGGS